MENNNLSLSQLSYALREKRVKLGYTIDYLAKLSKTSDRTCVKIENDAHGVKLDTLKKVAKVLGFNLEEETIFNLLEI